MKLRIESFIIFSISIFCSGCSSHLFPTFRSPEPSPMNREEEFNEPVSVPSLEEIGRILEKPFWVDLQPWHGSKRRNMKKVYLTFDDGPKPGRTRDVLNILDREKVKATFFLIGKKAVKYPDIVREILRRGHTVGNHTYSHMMPWGKNYNRYLQDALRGKKVLEKITNEEINLVRPPGGNLRLIQELEQAGMKVVLWTALSGDCTEGATPSYLLHLVKKQEKTRPIFHDQFVVLMHDTNTTTAKSLPSIIKYFRAKGYQFLSFNN